MLPKHPQAFFIYSLLILPVLAASIFGAGAFEKHVESAPAAREGETLPVQPAQQGASSLQPSVLLRAESGRSIAFKTQNGRMLGQAEPHSLELPHLVLLRNGRLTPEAERTLQFTLSGVQVPSPGVTATLSLETQHGDPDQGGDDAIRPVVLRQERWIPNPGAQPAVMDVDFRVMFSDSMPGSHPAGATPTDYYRYELTLTVPGSPAESSLYIAQADYAFLLDNEWVAALPATAGSEIGGPRELAVYYYDMLPFQADIFKPETRVQRQAVTSYVGGELLPAMLEAIQLQGETWGFNWDPSWRSYRSADRPGRLSVALTDGVTWYHGQAPSIGHAGISLKVSAGYGESAAYSSLTEKLMSVFHHELFHNWQRSLSLEHGGQGNVSGKDGAWAFFGEGMAVAASAAAQPEMQFSRAAGSRDYLASAGDFIQDLGQSYADANPYHAALYWRFLYEKCGGMQSGVENPRAGMAILRRTLQVLYSREIVDIDASTDLVVYLAPLMDAALGGSACPFQTHAQSLQAFSRSLYGLHLEDGRCRAPGLPAGCGLYDPYARYTPPAATAGSLRLADSIASSYGVDFIEMELEAGAQGEVVWVELSVDPQAGVRFGMDAILVRSRGAGPAQACSVGSLERAASDKGSYLVGVSASNAGCDRLVLIVTRLDAGEDLNPSGAYTIRVLAGLQGSAASQPGL